MAEIKLQVDYPEILLGIDIGSTTAKIVVVDNGSVVYEKYERHYSFVRKRPY